MYDFSDNIKLLISADAKLTRILNILFLFLKSVLK